MRWSSFLIIVAAVFSLFSCKNAEEKAVVQKEVKLPKMEETFPFAETEKIELLSYENRNDWDTIRRYSNRIVEDKKLLFDTTHVKERVVLNEKLTKDLFKAFFTPTPNSESAACFDPRHAVVFYNTNSEIIYAYEICFGCAVGQASNNDFKYTMTSVGTLYPVFKSAGIKYF
ncbi:hypothetical protein [Flavobacterium sp.]|uniref:hypothetical protein n=1 Tax=Flavobacterium sp. TaxID=239 RepID=UPI004033209A